MKRTTLGESLQQWVSLLSPVCGFHISLNRKAGEPFSEACLHIVP